ncbi:protein kinase [bacterium]|nr:protein kinase [bacterium]
MTQTLNLLSPGTLVHGRYRIEQLFGQGGMGAVYKATDERLGNPVALKQTLVSGAQMDKAFEREAKLLANLRHQALPKVSDYFADANGQFLAMEFIPGEDLGQMLTERKGQPFPLEVVLQWADRLLDALDYLHKQDPQIVHRDIKPENLKLTPDGDIILLDFGLAKGQVNTQTQMSNTKSVFGYTAQYAPPEQIEGSGTDGRSDIYALSVTLYYLLTGSPPANALSRTSALARRRDDPLQPAHLVHRQVPSGISSVLAKGMELDADRRYRTAGEMREALRKAPRTPTLAVPMWVWPTVGGTAVVLLLVLLGVVFASSQQSPALPPTAVAVATAAPTRSPAVLQPALPPPTTVSNLPTSTPVPDALVTITQVSPGTAFFRAATLAEQPLEFVVTGRNLDRFKNGEAQVHLEGNRNIIYAAQIDAASSTELVVQMNQVPALPNGKSESAYTVELTGLSPDDKVSFSITLRNFIRTETVAGVQVDYTYTGRVATDEQGAFTAMREQADVNSAIGARLRNGDELELLDEDVADWYQARILKSHDAALEQQIWWIERWLVTGKNAPPPPPPTEVPPPVVEQPPVAPPPIVEQPPVPPPAPHQLRHHPS